MLRRATHADRVDFMNTYGNLSAKLLRMFTAQLEALGRLQGNATQQTVRVEHVTVESGGQAVLGAVTTAPAGVPRERWVRTGGGSAPSEAPPTASDVPARR